MMYLLTRKPLDPELFELVIPPGVSLVPARWIPPRVQAIPHKGIYQIYSSQGCGCGFQGYENYGPGDSGYDQWQSEMLGMTRLLMRVAEKQPGFQLCTGWDFDMPVTRRSLNLRDLPKQIFEQVVSEEGEVWDWLNIYSLPRQAN